MSKPAFIPTVFANFGRSYADLQTKDQFEERDFTVKFVSKAVNNDFESGIRFAPLKDKSTRPIGFLQRAFSLPYKIGTLNGRITTENSFDFRLENTTAVKDVTLSAQSGFFPAERTGKQNGDLDGCTFGVAAAHSREYVSGALGLRTAWKAVDADAGAKALVTGPFVDAALSVGAEGVSVGGAVSYKVDTKEVAARSFGLEYAKGDAVVTLVSNEPEKATAAVFYRVDLKTQIGAGVDVTRVPSAAGAPVILTTVGTVASRVQLDRATSLKVAVTTQKKLAADVEYCFANPSVKLNFGATVDAGSRSLKTDTWSANVTIGDYLL